MPAQTKTFTYTVSLSRERDRDATVRAGDRPPIPVAPPEDFPAGDGRRWSPEHLFLGSLQSCTMHAFLSHAEHNGVSVQGYESRAEGTIMRRAEDGRYAFVFVRQRPVVTVRRGQRDAARAIVGKAERDCFISASTNAELQVDWEIRESDG